MGDTKLPVLRGVNLAVGAGEIVSIMGRSGSGKSTLLNIIAALEPFEKGRVQANGVAVEKLSRHQASLYRRNHLGIIYQFFNLIPSLNVEENILLPFLIAGKQEPDQKERAQEMLDLCGMLPRRKHMPSQLSGGEMQLVSIARALIRRPKLILADEPTGNVNLETGRLIMRKLQQAAGAVGCVVVMVTHSPEDAAFADRIVFLKDGRINQENSLRKGEADAAHIYGRLKELGI